MLFCAGIVDSYGESFEESLRTTKSELDFSGVLNGDASLEFANKLFAAQSPDFLFIAVTDGSGLVLWSAKPLAILASVNRDAESVAATGHVNRIIWHKSSRSFVLSTTRNFLLGFRLLETSNAYVHNASLPLVGLHLTNSLNFKLAAVYCVHYPHSITAVCAFDECILVASDEHSQFFAQLAWESPSFDKRRTVYVFPPGKVVHAEYATVQDVAVWMTDAGDIFVKAEATAKLCGWSGVQLPLNEAAVAYAINTKYALVTVATRTRIVAFKLTATLEVAWTIEAAAAATEASAVCALKWSASLAFLAVTFAAGGFAIYSYLGDALIRVPLGSEDAAATGTATACDDAAWTRTNVALFFAPGDCALVVVARAQQLKHATLSCVSLCRLPCAFDNAMCSRKFLLLAGDTYALLAKRPETKRIDYEYRIVSLDSIFFPIEYTTHNQPVRITSLSPSCAVLFVAGNRGFCLYLKGIRKWRIFANSSEEREFFVVAAPAFADNLLFVPVNALEGGSSGFEVRVFSLTAALSASNTLCRVPFAQRIIAVSFCFPFLFVLDVGGVLHIAQYSTALDVFQRLHAEMPVLAAVSIASHIDGASALLVNNFAVVSEDIEQQPQPQREDEEEGQSTARCFGVYFVAFGRLRKVSLKVCKSTAQAAVLAAHTVAQHVYYFFIEHRTIVAFKGPTAEIFFLPADFRIEEAAGAAALRPNIVIGNHEASRQNSDLRFVSNVCFASGITVSLRQGAAFKAAHKRTQYECVNDVHSLTSKLLHYFVSNAQIDLAHVSCRRAFLLQTNIEVFLYEAFEAYFADAANDSEAVSRAVSFAATFECFYGAIINMTRKIDAKFWRRTFAVLRATPLEIFARCMEAAAYGECVRLLIILREFETEASIVACCEKLVECLLVRDKFAEIFEIVRFLQSFLMDADILSDGTKEESLVNEESPLKEESHLKKEESFLKKEESLVNEESLQEKNASSRRQTADCSVPLKLPPKLARIAAAVWQRAVWYAERGLLHSLQTLAAGFAHFPLDAALQAAAAASPDRLRVGLHVDFAWWWLLVQPRAIAADLRGVIAKIFAHEQQKLARVTPPNPAAETLRSSAASSTSSVESAELRRKAKSASMAAAATNGADVWLRVDVRLLKRQIAELAQLVQAAARLEQKTLHRILLQFVSATDEGPEEEGDFLAAACATPLPMAD